MKLSINGNLLQIKLNLLEIFLSLALARPPLGGDKKSVNDSQAESQQLKPL